MNIYIYIYICNNMYNIIIIHLQYNKDIYLPSDGLVMTFIIRITRPNPTTSNIEPISIANIINGNLRMYFRVIIFEISGNLNI